MWPLTAFDASLAKNTAGPPSSDGSSHLPAGVLEQINVSNGCLEPLVELLLMERFEVWQYIQDQSRYIEYFESPYSERIFLVGIFNPPFAAA